MFLFRGVVELFRALADGIELGLKVLAPLDIPAQALEEEPVFHRGYGGKSGPVTSCVDEQPGSRSAGTPGGSGHSPLPAAGHLTAHDLTDAAAANLFWREQHYIPDEAGWAYWGRLADKFVDAAKELTQ